jgi:hypothetical protein
VYPEPYAALLTNIMPLVGSYLSKIFLSVQLIYLHNTKILIPTTIENIKKHPSMYNRWVKSAHCCTLCLVCKR